MTTQDEQTLLHTLSDEALRIYCYDTPRFVEAYDRITADTQHYHLIAWIDVILSPEASSPLRSDSPQTPYSLQVFLWPFL